MTCGAVFYGLQFSVTSLGGNPYINFLLAAAAEFPVCLLCYCTVRWCRRRLTMLVIFAVGGACSVAIGLLVFAGPQLAWLRQCLGIGGKVLASAALTVVWMFAAEVFPTVLRTVGVGACLVGTRRNYTNEAVPLIILGGFFFLSAILVLLLPETFRVALPDTLHETEGLTKYRGFPNGLHLVVYTFFFPVVEHWCAPPDTFSGNMTTDYWKTVALPRETGVEGSVRYSSCSMFPVERVGEELVAFENSTVPCERWQYGKSFYRHSLVQEWDLVCDSAWMRSLVQSATMAGMLVGSVLCSYLGDRLGRRPLIIMSFTLSLVCGLIIAVSPSYLFLLVVRLILGLGLGLGQASSFCLLMEVVGPCKRTTTAVAFSLGFAIGLLALPAFAWVFQDWRHLQAVISVPLVIFVAWSWYLPESPRWLVATGKLKKARKVLLQAGAANNIEIKNVDSIIEQLRRKITEQDEAAGEVNWFDLLRTRKVRRYSIILVYASMTSGAVFYGLQFSVTSLGGDPYVNFVLAAAAELPVCLLCYSSVRWCRRRRTMLAMFGVAGACSVAVGLLIFAGSTVAWLRQCLGIVGKLVASASLTVIWMFAAEVFPPCYAPWASEHASWEPAWAQRWHLSS
ncbi:hypothetical protein HPB47_010214 [Ixodes persulcatus]|uniref:Uncharacterized protein n=1 Tax=Ixodes persulcatus TaxID=34615 RepID=A0AC60NZW4_IXOPE|nr:hypothetical protein HPB47_010214 [Ixodes persulcatus]